jgi:membrane-associated phospholipid phosphatase/4-amino-4-deoxy-L-arabinose transferase-like glycosyltransferase
VLQSFDAAVFRFINGTLSNSFFDWLMPILAGGDWFLPVVFALGGLWIWTGGKRALLCAVLLLIVVPIGDGWITNTLKKTIKRPRPCLTLNDVNLPMKQANPRPDDENQFHRQGCTDTGSMPSGHATNWFAATAVVWIFYRKAWRFMLPMACLVGFSRIYNGVHYPGDVLMAAIIGTGYGLALCIGVNEFWRRAVVPFFPRWCAALPSLLPRPARLPEPQAAIPTAEVHWLRLGLVLIIVVLIARLWHAGTDRTDLSADEAFRWLWSKQIDLSHWWQTPLSVWVQWLSNKIFGSHEFAVRFLPPICLAVASIAAQHLFLREVGARASFCLVLILQLTPLLTAGSSLVGSDALLVMFSALAMFTGWRAMRPEGTAKDWALYGLWLGLSCFTNPAALVLPFCWFLFFALWKPARLRLRDPKIRASAPVFILFAAPVLFSGALWNAFVNETSAADLGPTWQTRFDTPWEFFLLSAVLLNPVFLAGIIWAVAGLWKQEPQNPLPRFFLALGAPLILGSTLFFLPPQTRLNWIAMSVIPLAGLLVMFWAGKFGEKPRLVSIGLGLGLVFGIASTALLHESGVIKIFTGSRFSPGLDPLQRVRGWTSMGRFVRGEYARLANEGTPAFVIGDNAGTTSLLTFYMPQARTNLSRTPIVYRVQKPDSAMQAFTWPAYAGTRTGQNAIYVQDSTRPDTAPPEITKQFASVTNAGTILIHHRGRPLRFMRYFICRDLQP